MSLHKKLTLILAVGMVVIIASGCVPAGLRQFLSPPTVTPVPAYTLPLTAAPQPTWTPAPPPTVKPTATPKPLPTTPTSDTLAVTVTEEEMNAYVAGESFSQEGADISDLQVKLTPAEMRIEGYVDHQATGLAGDLAISGAPVLVDGELYFKIQAVTLGPQFSGFIRAIAQGLIQELIQQEAGPNGIPIPVTLPEGMTITSVTLGDGVLLLEGVRE